MKNKRLLVVLFSLLRSTTLLLAQVKRTITGVVNDNNGKPVPSATVSVKGTTQSVITDENGRYSITVEKNNAVLVFSSVSFASRELAVGDSSNLNASLEATAGDLGEVVVTSLGISKKQKALGYAVSTIKAEDITLTGSSNFGAAL